MSSRVPSFLIKDEEVQQKKGCRCVVNVVLVVETCGSNYSLSRDL